MVRAIVRRGEVADSWRIEKLLRDHGEKLLRRCAQIVAQAQRLRFQVDSTGREERRTILLAKTKPRREKRTDWRAVPRPV